MLAHEKAGGFPEPFVGLVGPIHGQLLHEGLDLRSGGEFGQLHQRGEARDQIGIAHDAGAKIPLLPGGIRRQGAHRVPTQTTVLGKQGSIQRRFVQRTDPLQRPQGMQRGDRSIIRCEQLFERFRGGGQLAFHQKTLGG